MYESGTKAELIEYEKNPKNILSSNAKDFFIFKASKHKPPHVNL